MSGRVVNVPGIASYVFEHDARAVGADLRQRPVVVDDDHVATEHEVGLAGGDAHGVDIGRRLRDAQMAGHGAALLRQTGLVEHGRALAFQMRGHADQRADRDDAGAADAGDEDVPRLREVGRELRLRQSGEIHFSSPGLRFFRPPPLIVTKLGQKPLTQE